MPKFLMCPPDLFGVDYVINPWMRGHVGDVDRALAVEQWGGLVGLLSGPMGAEIELIEPRKGLPDMVFTANAGVVRGEVAVPAHFRFAERQGEESHFAEWFASHGFRVASVGAHQEGAGDFLFLGDTLFGAYGFRTDASAHPPVGRALGVEVVSLALADPRFYHLDTCFCPLPGGRLLWCPPAFKAESRAAVEARVPSSHRFAVDDADAAGFACNAVGVEGHVVANHLGPETQGWLRSQGFEPHVAPLGEFMKAGGGAKCLTLRLD